MASLNNTTFNLDSSGVAGFFGGEEAVSAMGTVHMYRWQKWFGWYNSPGSYTVAKQYGKLARSRFWDALFPGENVEPAIFFELDGKAGPEYIASQSGTRIHASGHLAYIFSKAAQQKPPIQISPNNPDDKRKRPSLVTIVDLDSVKEMSPELLRQTSFLIGGLVIAANLASCIACAAVVGDWYCFAMILLGIISNGVSTCIIGSGKLKFIKPRPSEASPRADGILISDSEVVVLRGREHTVGAVLTGKFDLEYSGSPRFESIGVCSLFQYAQFLAQLLLIPQGTLFGQVMFLASLFISWMYNCYLSSLEKEALQIELISKIFINLNFKRFELRTRTTMVVFALLILKPANPKALLNRLLPNDTPTWRIWKRRVLKKIDAGAALQFDSSNYNRADPSEKGLLKDLYHDAETAYRAYMEHFDEGRIRDLDHEKLARHPERASAV